MILFILLISKSNFIETDCVFFYFLLFFLIILITYSSRFFSFFFIFIISPFFFIILITYSSRFFSFFFIFIISPFFFIILITADYFFFFFFFFFFFLLHSYTPSPHLSLYYCLYSTASLHRLGSLWKNKMTTFYLKYVWSVTLCQICCEKLTIKNSLLQFYYSFRSSRK